MANTAPLLSIEKVDVYYGAVQALFGVSIDVHAGEVVAVLGGNASGKSTTVKSVLGLVKPRTGRIMLNGARIDGQKPSDIIKHGVASIPEGRRVFPDMSVEENLLMGAYARREVGLDTIRKDMEDVWPLFPRLKERLAQPAGTLSGGEQQMLAMARAILRKPSLVTIDEPSMGLSPLFVDRVYEVLHNWKASGMTILIVEQNARLALEVADRAYVLQHGQVVLTGAAADLRSDPAVQRAYLSGS